MLHSGGFITNAEKATEDSKINPKSRSYVILWKNRPSGDSSADNEREYWNYLWINIFQKSHFLNNRICIKNVIQIVGHWTIIDLDINYLEKILRRYFTLLIFWNSVFEDRWFKDLGVDSHSYHVHVTNVTNIH